MMGITLGTTKYGVFLENNSLLRHAGYQSRVNKVRRF